MIQISIIKQILIDRAGFWVEQCTYVLCVLIAAFGKQRACTA
jgi:hypothetical protein